MKKDIENSADIELLINTFYDKVKLSPVIGYIFYEVAKVNWTTHLPKMYTFWNSLLLGEQRFMGDPMKKHIDLSKHTAMTEAEFSEWLLLFSQTVDSLFKGEKAEEAKGRASNIAQLMLFKIHNAQNLQRKHV